MLVKRWRRIVASVAMGMAIATFGVASPAHASDDYLVASDPDRHQELKRMPGWVTLVFRSAANAKLAKILVLDSAGKNISTGALIVEDTNVTTQLAFDVPKGTYTVMYRTSGTDGRVRGGSYQFAYGKGTWGNEQKEVWIGEEEQPPVLNSPDPNATGSATPSVSPSATAEPSSASPSGAASTPSGSPSPAPAGGDSQLPWIIGASALIVAVAGGSGVYVWRRRRG